MYVVYKLLEFGLMNQLCTNNKKEKVDDYKDLSV